MFVVTHFSDDKQRSCICKSGVLNAVDDDYCSTYPAMIKMSLKREQESGKRLEGEKSYD